MFESVLPLSQEFLSVRCKGNPILPSFLGLEQQSEQSIILPSYSFEKPEFIWAYLQSNLGDPSTEAMQIILYFCGVAVIHCQPSKMVKGTGLSPSFLHSHLNSRLLANTHIQTKSPVGWEG